MTIEEKSCALGASTLERRVMPIALGTETEWGKIEMVGITGGERYYWMVDRNRCVSMIPAFIVELHNAEITAGRPMQCCVSPQKGR